MKYLRQLGFAAALVGLHAAASAATYGALTGTGFTTETGSSVNQYLMPIAPAGSSISSFSVLSTAAGFSPTGTLTFASPVTSYTFLWGSPDSFNRVSDGVMSVNGSAVSSGTGNNAESLPYTFTDAAGFSSLTFSSGGVAFEVAAVSPVPEPASVALLFGGLGAILLVARRRSR